MHCSRPHLWFLPWFSFTLDRAREMDGETSSDAREIDNREWCQSLSLITMIQSRYVNCCTQSCLVCEVFVCNSSRHDPSSRVSKTHTQTFKSLASFHNRCKQNSVASVGCPSKKAGHSGRSWSWLQGDIKRGR